jgi:hypothetical protein
MIYINQMSEDEFDRKECYSLSEHQLTCLIDEDRGEIALKMVGFYPIIPIKDIDKIIEILKDLKEKYEGKDFDLVDIDTDRKDKSKIPKI